MSEKEEFVFELRVIGSDEVVKAEAILKQYKAALNAALKANDTEAIGKYSAALSEQSKIVTALKKDLNLQTKALLEVPGSSKAAEIGLKRLTIAFNSLSDAEKKSDIGISLNSKIKALSSSLTEQTGAIDKQGYSLDHLAEKFKLAFERPLKFIQGVGLVGIFVTLADAMFRIGENAIEAFSKTEDGAKKLEKVEKGIAGIRAVTTGFVEDIISSFIPLTEEKLPKLTMLVIDIVAAFAGLYAAGKAFFHNLGIEAEKFGNAVQIVGLKAEKLSTSLLFGNTDDLSKRIEDLIQKNKELDASFVDPNKAGQKAFNYSQDVSLMRLAIEQHKKDKQDEADTLLKILKDRLAAEKKILEDRAAKGLNTDKISATIVKLEDRIAEIEGRIKIAEARTEEERLTVQKKLLEEAQAKLNVTSVEYLNTSLKILEIEKQLNAIADKKFALQEKISKGIRVQIKIPELPTDNSINTIEQIDQADSKAAQRRLERLKEVNDKSTQISLKNAKDKTDALIAKKKEEDEAIKQIGVDSLNAELNAFGDLLNQKYEMQKAANDKLRDDNLKSLNAEYDKKKEFARGNAEIISQIEKERADKEAAINKEAAKKNKAIAIKQAIILGAQAGLQALANTTLKFPLSLLALIPIAAQTLAQIGKIQAQGFAEGGSPWLNLFKGKVHTGVGLVQGAGTKTSDSVPARLSKGEYVWNAKMVDIVGIDRLEAFRKSTLSGMSFTAPENRKAQGGSVGSLSSGFIPNISLPPTVTGNSNLSATFSNDQIILMTDFMAKNIAQEVGLALSIGLNAAHGRGEREAYARRRSQG